MKLQPYLNPKAVLLDLKAKELTEVIHALVERAQELGITESAARLEELLLSQEAVHTTAMGDGVAIPHATLAGLAHPVLLVAVAPEGTDFGPIGLDPVHLFFLLVSPDDQTGLHIKLLARIARLIRHPGLIERLRHSRSSTELLEELERVDAEHV
jgi:PTS system nitrogen regulatory IIA component